MGKDAPKPMPAQQVAQQDEESHLRTADAQRKMAMVNQKNPFGTLRYVTDPKAPGGYRAVTDFSAPIQDLFNQGVDMTKAYGTTVSDQLGRVNDQLSQPFMFDAARAKVLSDVNQKLMDPLWQQRDEALQTQLANEGIMPGSEAYARRTGLLGDERSRAYDQMFLDSYDKANQTALMEHELPLQDYAKLLGAGSGASIPGMPQFQSTPAPGVAPTDTAGIINNQYKQESDNYNAQMAGLYGLGAAGLGGWARGGFALPKFA